MKNIIQIKPKLAYKLLGTGLQVDPEKVYDAIIARNIPNWKERECVFVEEALLLEKDEYTIVHGKFPK